MSREHETVNQMVNKLQHIIGESPNFRVFIQNKQFSLKFRNWCFKIFRKNSYKKLAINSFKSYNNCVLKNRLDGWIFMFKDKNTFLIILGITIIIFSSCNLLKVHKLDVSKDFETAITMKSLNQSDEATVRDWDKLFGKIKY